MRRISADTIVDMPRSEAWTKMQDLTLSKYYVPGVTDIEITSTNRSGLGASRKVFVKGRPPLDETVVEWDEGQGFVVKVHQGDQPSPPFKQSQFVYRLDDAPQGQTKVTTAMVYELPKGLRWSILDHVLIRHVVGRTVKAISRNLKRVYEDEPPAA